MTRYSYQQPAINDAVEFLRSAGYGARRLYSSPTGTGKSVMELGVLRELPRAMLVTPRVEIIEGMLAKLGVAVPESEAKMLDVALSQRITTPIRLRNMLSRGEAPFRVEQLIIDEAHHDEAQSYRELDALLGGIPAVGFTATPYRGTVAGTVAFLKRWGDEVTRIISIPEAASRGVISIPETQVWPLVDDDQIKVSNGEIDVTAAGKAVTSRLGDLCGILATRRWVIDGAWDRATMFSVPNTSTAVDLVSHLTAGGLPATIVVQDTTRGERRAAFAACLERRAALVQINVVSEGVDLPIRRLIDLAPTLSPVRWLQQLGRITRPGGESQYICTNRNLARHCYLMEGTVPLSEIREAQQAFGGISKRDGLRAVGLESLGRFKATELPLSGGVKGLMYSLTAVEGFTRTDYAVLCHPGSSEPIFAKRQNARREDGTLAYGRWSRCEALPDLTGFASADDRDPSEKQLEWWSKSAESRGLDKGAKVNRRNFAALPILSDLRMKLKGDTCL